jgi:DNA-binding transcriptional LysR family regulator
MRDLDLKTLRLLVAVCEHQNIKQAALQEHIEPSAISKRIAALEADLGTPLLQRGRRGVLPTPAGQALLEHARSMLFTMEQVEQDMAAFSAGTQGHVRLVASASAIAESLLDDVAAFMRAPQNRLIKVDIEERFSRDLVRIVRDGSAALGVCWDSIAFEGLATRPYRRDELALAVHAEHPLARHKKLAFADTLAHEHVGLQPATAVHMMLRRAAAQAGGSLHYRVIVSNFDAAFRVVAANLGIAVVPRQVGAAYVASGVRLVGLSDAWARRRFAVCFRPGGLTAAGERMCEHLAALAEG